MSPVFVTNGSRIVTVLYTRGKQMQCQDEFVGGTAKDCKLCASATPLWHYFVYVAIVLLFYPLYKLYHLYTNIIGPVSPITRVLLAPPLPGTATSQVLECLMLMHA